MSSAAIRCTVLNGHDYVLEIGRKLRARNSAQVSQIFVRRKMLLCRERYVLIAASTNIAAQGVRPSFRLSFCCGWKAEACDEVRAEDTGENVPCSAGL